MAGDERDPDDEATDDGLDRDPEEALPSDPDVQAERQQEGVEAEHDHE